jgi:hypothetical protein
MHPHLHHHHHHHHLQQAMYAQQQQEASLLYQHQYNQLNSMQAAYSNPTLAYAQQPIDQSQQQQLYRTDQIVPQPSSQIPTPVQQQQIQEHVQQQIQRSSPINMIQISSPDVWVNGSPTASQDVFRPISHSLSRSIIDVGSYNNHNNSVSSNPSSPQMAVSYESPKLNNRHYSKQQTSPANYRRRERLHSGSSCYESDSSDLSNDDEEEYEVKKFRFNNTYSE